MAKLDETAAGVYIIAVTPFTDNGALDLDSTDRMVDFYLERGVTGFTILGMMGEAPKLALAERSEEHTSELQSLMRISYAVFCLKKKKKNKQTNKIHIIQKD